MDINEIKVIKKNIEFMDLINLVNFIVSNSFSEDSGEYHEYLRDAYETLGILVSFTNYQIGDQDMKLSDLMNELFEIRTNDKWENEILSELDEIYYYIDEYVTSEIHNRMRPLANFDTVLNSANRVMKQFSDIAGAIDLNALAQFDYSKLVAAVNAINMGNEDNNESNAEAKNVVPFKPSAGDN